MSQILSCTVAAVAGYLLGSISTGLIVAKKSSHVDIRQEGSRSTGATNVLRVLGKKPAAITFVGDFLKVLLAMIIGSLLDGQYGAMMGGLAGIIGHNWPIYYQFKGGKGVASSVAVMLYVFPVFGVIALLFFFLLVALTKYISLGSIAMLTLFAALVIIFNWGSWLICAWAIAIAALSIIRHRANIGRLLKGTENKLALKSK